MAIHELKTDQEPFGMSFAGNKTYEIRCNDRDFKVGDMLVLRETMHSGEAMSKGAPLEYTGRVLSRMVNEVRANYGLQDGWCILAVTKV